MASSINASTSGSGGVITTADNSGVLNLQSSGTTVATIQPSGLSLPSGSTFNAANTFGFKNRLINGNMVIDQRFAGASTTPVGTKTYTLDRWTCYLSQASKYSVQQNAGSVTPPAGFTNYLGVTSLSAYTVGAAENFMISQLIEGYNISDLAWGTNNAKTVTLSFQVYSSLTGTFGGALGNSAGTRSYPFSYTISSANTWTTISVTIPGDTTGTWLTTTAAGIVVYFGLGVGSTYSGTANAWAGTYYASSTGATSVVGTNGATFYLTGVQLEVGSQATSFDFRSYGTELALCQRYYWTSTKSTYNAIGSGIWSTTTQAVVYVKHPVSMRASPTFGYSGTLYVHVTSGSSAVSAIAAQYSGLDSTRLDLNASSSTTAGFGAVLFSDNGPTNYLYAGAEL